MTKKPRLRGAATLMCMAALALPLAACGEDEPDGRSADGGSSDGAPSECAEPFPLAVLEPDLGQVELLPDDFPEPPVDAVLCETSSTVDDSYESVSYASDAAAEEVLAGYEQALTEHRPTRAEDGLGQPVLDAQVGDVVVQVQPRDGGFRVVFAQG